MTVALERPLAAGPDERTALPLAERIFDRTGSVRSLALLRMMLGPCVWLHLWPFVSDLRSGIRFDDRFFEPWATWLPVPPGWVQPVLVGAAAIGAGFLTVGLWTRAASVVTFVGVAGNFFLSQTYFRHNRAFLIILLAGVALAPAGKVLSLDSLRRRRADASERAPGGDRDTVWVLWLLRYMAASVYFASGFSKLIDPDWRAGVVLWDRAVRYQHEVFGSPLPQPVAELVVDVVTNRAFHSFLSPLAIVTELFIAVGLWFGRTRLAAIWVAIWFHLSIQLAASVEVFSVAAIAALVIWATPSTRDRLVIGGPGWLWWLDWLARFRHERAGAQVPLRVLERDGTERTGADAGWFVASRLPLTFLLAAPAVLVRGLAGRGRGEDRSGSAILVRGLAGRGRGEDRSGSAVLVRGLGGRGRGEDRSRSAERMG